MSETTNICCKVFRLLSNSTSTDSKEKRHTSRTTALLHQDQSLESLPTGPDIQYQCYHHTARTTALAGTKLNQSSPSPFLPDIVCTAAAHIKRDINSFQQGFHYSLLRDHFPSPPESLVGITVRHIQIKQ